MVANFFPTTILLPVGPQARHPAGVDSVQSGVVKLEIFCSYGFIELPKLFPSTFVPESDVTFNFC